MIGFGLRWSLTFIGHDSGEAAKYSNFKNSLARSACRLLWFAFFGGLLWAAASEGWLSQGWVINEVLRVDNEEWRQTLLLALVGLLVLGSSYSECGEAIYKISFDFLLSLTDALGVGLGVVGVIFVTEIYKVSSGEAMMPLLLYAIACWSVVFLRAAFCCSAEPVRALFVILMSDRNVRLMVLMLSALFVGILVFKKLLFFSMQKMF